MKQTKLKKYVYFLGYGNNSELIRKLMQSRETWEEYSYTN